MAREAGARKVIFASCAPPITHPHIYGIDLASRRELIAHDRSNADIAGHIGAEAVVYQDLEDLKAACAELSPRDPKTQDFEVGVFCGKYCTPVPDGYLEHLDEQRGKKRKLPTQSGNSGPVRVATGAAVDAAATMLLAVNGGSTNGGSKSPEPPRTPADRQDIR